MNTSLRAIAVLLLVAGYAHPTIAQLVTDTTRFSDTVRSMEKKKLVTEHLNLSEAEKAAFWPLYESYNQAIRYIEMETLEILDTYHRMGPTIHSADLEKYAKRIMTNDVLLAKVRKQYYRKMSKALSPNVATSFLQFDDTMRMLLRFEVKSKNPDAMAKASLR